MYMENFEKEAPNSRAEKESSFYYISPRAQNSKQLKLLFFLHRLKKCRKLHASYQDTFIKSIFYFHKYKISTTLYFQLIQFIHWKSIM